jgi:hypothetical protein
MLDLLVAAVVLRPPDMWSIVLILRASMYGWYSVTDRVGTIPIREVACASTGASTVGSSFGVAVALAR